MRVTKKMLSAMEELRTVKNSKGYWSDEVLNLNTELFKRFTIGQVHYMNAVIKKEA